MVFFVFPIFMTSVNIIKGVVLFKRGAIADKQVMAHKGQGSVVFTCMCQNCAIV
jgi:hypothetical protein